MDIEQFVVSYLPRPPARVLEVGCGSGELARALAERGYDVTAIDPEAPHGAMFRRVALEAFSEQALFEAVVASRSLHHVEDLQAGVDKISALLATGGALILNEFAWDRMDGATAAWYLSHLDEPGPHDASLLPESFPDAWIAEHEDLHGIEAIKNALESRFRMEVFEWVPYIAHHYLEREDLAGEEAALIASGDIQAVGFRCVGRRA